MIDTDIIVVTVTPSSPFDRLPPGFGDPDPDHLDRLAASLHHLALSGCESGANQPSQQPPAEAMAEHEQLCVDAVAAAGEQL